MAAVNTPAEQVAREMKARDLASELDSATQEMMRANQDATEAATRAERAQHKYRVALNNLLQFAKSPHTGDKLEMTPEQVWSAWLEEARRRAMQNAGQGAPIAAAWADGAF